MRPALATELPLAHLDPEVIARYVDGRDVSPGSVGHLRACELCRTRASDARLLRALIAGNHGNALTTTIKLDASTIAGYHDQSLPVDQMSAVDRRLLTDDQALLELIELRIGLHSASRATPPHAQLVARTAAAFSSGPTQSTRMASLGTLMIDWNSELPAFHFHAATPENLASIGSGAAVLRPAINDSGSFPAPAARREVTLHAGRNTIRVRMAAGERIELFIFDEQHFRPASGVDLRFEPDDGEPHRITTKQTGIAGFELLRCHARLLIDAGDRWVLEIR